MWARPIIFKRDVDINLFFKITRLSYKYLVRLAKPVFKFLASYEVSPLIVFVATCFVSIFTVYQQSVIRQN
jgi:hypothetical protein